MPCLLCGDSDVRIQSVAGCEKGDFSKGKSNFNCDEHSPHESIWSQLVPDVHGNMRVSVKVFGEGAVVT